MLRDSQTLQKFADKRLIFVTGKGGVGKTTLSCLLAKKLAAQNKNILLVEFAPSQNIPKFFGVTNTDDQQTILEKNISAITLKPESCFKDYVIRKIRWHWVYETFLQNQLVQNFVEAAPGLGEILMMGKTVDFLKHTTTADEAKHKYDCVIVDAPASGHGLSLLQIPYVLKRAAPFGPLHHQAEQIITTLEDHNTTSLVLVTLAQDLSVNETIETWQNIQSRTNIALGAVCINRILPKVLEINSLATAKLPKHLEPYRQSYDFAQQRAMLQNENLEKLGTAFTKDELIFMNESAKGLYHAKDLAHCGFIDAEIRHRQENFS